MAGNAAVKNAATVTPAGATNKKLAYTSSNTKVATVDAKGSVKPVAAGKATIKATAKDGSKKYATCKVSVAARVVPTGVAFDKSSLTLDVSDKPVKNAAKVTPSNATNKAVSYSSSDKAVATVSTDGTITPKAAGTATITAKTAEGNRQTTCKVTVTTRNPVATNTLELRKLLLSDKPYDSITFDSTDVLEGPLELAKMDHPNTVLVIKAPNVFSIRNYSVFKEVDIKALSRGGYGEDAGNALVVSAPDANIEVSDHCSNDTSIRLLASVKRAAVTTVSDVSDLVVDTKGDVAIDNSASIHKLVINADADVDLVGSSRQGVMQTELNAAPTIHTRFALDVMVGDGVTKPATIILDEGSQGTAVTARRAEVLPSVRGLDTVTATVADAAGSVMDRRTVVATFDDGLAASDTIKTVPEVYGYATDAADFDTGIEGATVRMYPWTAQTATGEVDGLDPCATATTDDEGAYEFDDVKAGNYVLVFEAEGYARTWRSLVLKNVEDPQRCDEVALVPTGVGDVRSTVNGTVVDETQSGDVRLAHVTLRLRAGSNNLTGPVLQTTVSNEEGEFAFADQVAAGTYTIEAVDLRGEAPTYVSTSLSVAVTEPGDTTCLIVMTPGLDRSSLRFVLEWSSNDDLSIGLKPHLYGPSSDGGLLHVYYANTNQVEDDKVVAWLEQQSVGHARKDTTTVARLAGGTYTFFVHAAEATGIERDEALHAADARVKVYSGLSLVDEFAVPQGKGTVWAVCTYDPVTKQFAPLDELSYDDANWENVGIDTLHGGLKVTEVTTNELVSSYEIVGDEIWLTLTEPLGDANVDQVQMSATKDATVDIVKVDDGTVHYEAMLTDAQGNVRTYWLVCTVDYGDLYVERFNTNDVVTDFVIRETEIDLTVTDLSLDAYRDFVEPVVAAAGATYSVGADEEGNPCLTISAGGRSRTYAILAMQDWGDLGVTGFELNDVVTDYSVYGGYVYIVNPNRPFDEYKDQIVPIIGQQGTSYELSRDDEGALHIVISNGTLTRDVGFAVKEDHHQGLRVASIPTNDVITDQTVIDNKHDRINVYVTNDDFEVWSSRFAPVIGPVGATYELEDEGDTHYLLTLTSVDGAIHRYYDVYAYRDWQGLELDAIPTNDVITRAQVMPDTVKIHVVDTSFDYWKAALEAAVAQEGFGCRVSDEDGAYCLTLLGDGSERTYAVEVFRDWRGVALEGLEINDIIENYEVTDSESGDSWLELTVTRPDFEDWRAAFRPEFGATGVDWQLVEDGEEYSLILTVGEVVHYYHIDVIVDWQGLVLFGVTTNDVVTNYGTGEDYVDITVTTDDFDVWSAAFEPEVHERDDYEWQIVRKDDGYELLLSAGGVTRHYDLYVDVASD